jgi:hypothetical protein
MRISYSAVDKYKTCSMMYKLHYVDKIREVGTTSALLFGSAVDEALNYLILNYKKKDRLENTISIFNTEMSKWLNNFTVKFYNNDFDKRILTPYDIEIIDSACKLIQNHYFGWFSLYRKGISLIKSYNKDIIPNIKKVKSVQKKIFKKNQKGDSIIMFLDAEIMWKGDSEYSVVDNKTSSSSYSRSKIEKSPQLALYSFFSKNSKISYVVLRKDLNSKGTVRPIQVLHHDCEQEVIEEVLNEVDLTMEKIKNKEFSKTSESWKCNKIYGKKCIYYDICHNNKNYKEIDGLIKK